MRLHTDMRSERTVDQVIPAGAETGPVADEESDQFAGFVHCTDPADRMEAGAREAMAELLIRNIVKPDLAISITGRTHQHRYSAVIELKRPYRRLVWLKKELHLKSLERKSVNDDPANFVGIVRKPSVVMENLDSPSPKPLLNIRF